MKKRYLIIALLLGLSISILYSQEDYPSGNPIGRIFVDYRYSLNKAEPYQGFNVNRAWLGYKYNIDNHFSAQVIIDIGSPLGTAGTDTKRYAFFRNALVSYNNNNFTLTVGLTDARSAKSELMLWGKRYISRPFLLNYKFTNIADLGIVVDYKISDVVSIDAAILNGEGYTRIEADNRHLYGFGVTVVPLEGLVLRGYADIYKRVEATKNTFSGIAGYRNDKFSIAFGYNYKTDFDWTDGNNTGGFTTFGAINISPKLEIFGRYDRLRSVTLEGETEGWNILNDGSLLVTGVQYKIIKQLKASINYQGWTPSSTTSSSWNFLQANLEFRF